MSLAYVGLGANLGDPLRQLESALAAIARLPQTRLAARSSIYRTAPIGYADQPEFLNAAARLETDLEPEPLLEHLLEIESGHGRVRSMRDAPRTLDLDLLLYDSRVLATPRLELPHPRMHARAFVLAPLAEIAPELEVPGHGPVGALLARCPDQVARRLDA